MPTPAQNITTALNAYNDVVRGRTKSKDDTGGPSGSEFADLVKGAINEAKKIGERS